MKTKKFLYLISQTEVEDFDSYDSAVVCAESEEKARDIHPRGGSLPVWKLTVGTSDRGEWARNRESVKVKLLGIAVADSRSIGVVCASFNAG